MPRALTKTVLYTPNRRSADVEDPRIDEVVVDQSLDTPHIKEETEVELPDILLEDPDWQRLKQALVDFQQATKPPLDPQGALDALRRYMLEMTRFEIDDWLEDHDGE